MFPHRSYMLHSWSVWDVELPTFLCIIKNSVNENKNVSETQAAAMKLLKIIKERTNLYEIKTKICGRK
jgi:hypothetical protein